LLIAYVFILQTQQIRTYNHFQIVINCLAILLGRVYTGPPG